MSVGQNMKQSVNKSEVIILSCPRSCVDISNYPYWKEGRKVHMFSWKWSMSSEWEGLYLATKGVQKMANSLKAPLKEKRLLKQCPCGTILENSALFDY